MEDLHVFWAMHLAFEAGMPDVWGDEQEETNPSAPFSPYGEITGFSFIEKEDHEMEDTTEVSQSSAYWTQSGDNPVIYDQATQADLQMSAGGWSLIEPEYCPRLTGGRIRSTSATREQRELSIKTLRWLYAYKGDMMRMRQAYGRFRRRWFEDKKLGKYTLAYSDAKLVWDMFRNAVK